MIWRAEDSDDAVEKMLAELNRRIARLTQAHNTEPDPEMGGLSPEQVARLIHSDWGAADSPVRFNDDVPLADLEGAEIFRNVRMLLRAIHDAGGVRATAAMKLPRAFVMEMLPRIHAAADMEKILACYKRPNEENVWCLHIARIVAGVAGLVRRRKGAFTVPRAKAGLLADGRAGELFRCLFVAYFRRFNMAYAFPYGIAAPAVQSCAGYSLYRLGRTAADWRAAKDLPADVLLPAVRGEIEEALRDREYFTLMDALTSRLLDPLMNWGLLEARYRKAGRYRQELAAVRVTPLFEAFLRFDLPG